MARARWLWVDRIAAAVAATQSPQRVSLYNSPTVEVLAGHLDGSRAPRHRRPRGSEVEKGRQDQELGDDEQPCLEVDAAPV
jgi:hypothetical protein